MRRSLMILSFCWAVPACAASEPPRASSAATQIEPAPPAPATRTLLVTPDKGLGRPVWVLAVLDFHTQATSRDKGFEELRSKAVALGADAVTDAEFEHGEGNEPSHLSGMAVKFATDDPRPYDVLGEIDIATNEDEDDKGFELLLAKARALGADEVRSISFEHGAEGAMSHVKGTAVKFRP